MDNDQPQTSFQPTPKIEEKKKPRGNRILAALLALLLAAATGGGVYFWQMQEVSDLEDKNAELSAKVSDLESKAADSSDSSADNNDDTSTTSPLTAENITDAVSSGNYAALEGYMADTVRVIIAASEGVGDRTPVQAVEDLKYLDSGDDPWDFNVSEETLLEWRFGDYASYFPISAVVGKSSDGMVVSFQFDTAGNISVVFMAASEDIL